MLLLIIIVFHDFAVFVLFFFKFNFTVVAVLSSFPFPSLAVNNKDHDAAVVDDDDDCATIPY